MSFGTVEVRLSTGPVSCQVGGSGDAAGAKQPRFLRILVEKPGQEQINVRVPLSLCRTGKLFAFLPSRVSERLAERGIDLSGFNSLRGEDLEEALRTVNIDLEKDDGKKVRVFCE
jgi:hypothetical protein